MNLGGRNGDAYLVIGSNGGLASYPAWYYNLSAEPRVAMEVRDERLTMQAATAEGTGRTRLWAEIVERYPNFITYQEGVTRELPVVMLRPTS
jgi:deazaflavin-dependent oxidoreductase (nitroreductase family)